MAAVLIKAHAAQDYYTTETHAVVVVWMGQSQTSAEVSLVKPDGSVLAAAQGPADHRTVALSVELSLLYLGRNHLVATVESATAKVVVTRLPPHPSSAACEVKMHHAGALLVDGLPLYPVGFYCYSPVDVLQLDTEVAKGFNFASPYHKPDMPLRDRLAYLDHCAALNLRVNYQVTNLAGGGGVYSVRNNNDDEKGGDKYAALREEVLAVRSHPALLSWYTCE
jgi:hypothetical protein